MTLTKREYVALELLKVKDITVIEAYELADIFIAKSLLEIEHDNVKMISDESIDKISSLDPIFSFGIETLEMSVRTTGHLKNRKIKTIEHLVLSKISDVFPTDTYNDICYEAITRLKSIGLSFAMNKYEVLDYTSAEYVQIIKGLEGEPILKPVS